MTSVPREPALTRFAQAVAPPIDLGEAALCLGLGEDPRLDLDPWRARLDAMGCELAARFPAAAPGGASSVLPRLQALRGYLFAEIGLLGNEADYYDPRNSYLHHVLQRGLGIPISLAVITIEVARRAGLGLHGVGFPSHFLVGAPGGVYLDPFHQGRLLAESDCAELLRQMTRGEVPFRRELLAPSGTKAILARMLRNLESIHLRRGELDLALLDVDRLLLLDTSPLLRRDRGLINLARHDFAAAVQDLQHYLDGDPSDAARIRSLLDAAERGLADGS